MGLKGPHTASSRRSISTLPLSDCNYHPCLRPSKVQAWDWSMPGERMRMFHVKLSSADPGRKYAVRVRGACWNSTCGQPDPRSGTSTADPLLRCPIARLDATFGYPVNRSHREPSAQKKALVRSARSRQADNRHRHRPARWCWPYTAPVAAAEAPGKPHPSSPQPSCGPACTSWACHSGSDYSLGISSGSLRLVCTWGDYRHPRTLPVMFAATAISSGTRGCR
ncbi:hypothetical protein ABIE00_004765 [Arthrobacter sp. OAP107]